MSLSASASGSGSGSGLLLASGSAAAAPSFAPPSSPTKAATGANGGVILPGEGNLWSSILDSVKTTKAVQSKQCIVLGAPRAGKSSLVSRLRTSDGHLPQHLEPDNQDPSGKGKALDLGMSYEVMDVRDDGDEGDVLGRLGSYQISTSEPARDRLVSLALSRCPLVDSLAVIVLDWRRPWTFVQELEYWIDLLETALGRDEDGAEEREQERDEGKRRLEATLRAYQEPTTSGAMPSSTSTSNLHAADAPLPTGTLLENLGLGLVIVCTKADQMSMLERDREFSEDLFDYVQQLIRTVALRYGAAVFYTSQTNPASYAKLRQYILHRLFAPDPSSQLAATTPTPTPTAASSRTAPVQSTPRQSARASFPFLHRANVVDRDQVLVPAGWDTWGKIKILRERFDCEACGQRWEADLEAERSARDTEVEPGKVREPVNADGLGAEYASAVVNFEARNQFTASSSSLMQAEDEQAFLRQQYEVLQAEVAKDPRLAFRQPVAGSMSSTGFGPSSVGPMAGSTLDLPTVASTLERAREAAGASARDNGLPVRADERYRSSMSRQPARSPQLGGAATSPPTSSAAAFLSRTSSQQSASGVSNSTTMPTTPGSTSTSTAGNAAGGNQVLADFFQSLLTARTAGAGAAVPGAGSKWCELHEELQAKLLKSYKRLTYAYEVFDDSTLPAHLEGIASEESLNTLRAWSEAARSKWSFARRVIVARAEHHQQFYAGGDWGHAQYLASVSQEQQRMELLLRALEQRAYEVTLERSSASWVLGLADAPVMLCDDRPTSTAKSSAETLRPRPVQPRSKAKALPKETVGTNAKARNSSDGSVKPGKPTSAKQLALDSDAAFFASLAPSTQSTSHNPRDLLRLLCAYLEPPGDLPETVPPSMWTALVESVFRIVVLRVPALATLALTPVTAVAADTATVKPCGCSAVIVAGTCSDQPLRPASAPSSVRAFLDLLEDRLRLDDQNEGDSAVVALWQALKYAKNKSDKGEGCEQDGLIDVGVLMDAIDTVLLEEEGLNESGDSMALLGGRVWKETRTATWRRAHWDLFYQLVGCPGCSLIATRDFSTWTRNRRLALLGRYRDWSTDATLAERIFRLSDVVLCTSNSCHAGKKVRRVEQKCSDCGKRSKHAKKVVYIEEWEAGWMYIKLPLHDCRSRQILNYLASLPERYQVLARNVAEDQITHYPLASSSKGSCAEKGCSCARNEMPLARVRSGMSPVERKGAKWTTTTVLPADTILASLSKSSSPETRFHDKPYQDVLEAVVLDTSPYSSATHDSWLAFATQVAEDLLAAQGYACFDAMLADRLKSAVACGDVSLSTGSERAYRPRKQDGPSSGMNDRIGSRANADRRSSSPRAAEPLARSLFREEERPLESVL